MADNLEPRQDPGLPVPNPCVSFWQQTTRSFPYLNVNKDEPVPTESKYVIIGSGISGGLTTYELIQGGVSASDIIILEAREAASGASSRNAGHVRPDAFRGFQVYKQLHGKEQALKIIANEKLVFERVKEFTEKHNVQCDFNPTTTFDVCMTSEFADFNARSFKQYQDAGGDVSHIKFYSGEEARRVTRVSQAVAAYEWPAGSSHPAKLAQWLLTQCIAQGVKLYTHCPALSVTKSGTSPADSVVWEISTPRGTTKATTVIHCTNAFAPYLLPQLTTFITPNRAQAHAFVPPPSLSAANILPSTMSLRHTLKHFYSVAQRRPDGIIILGAPIANPKLSPDAALARLTTNDGVYNEEVRKDCVENFETTFEEAEKGRLRHGEGLLHTWTGIVGMTTDSVPFVGRVEGAEGQWVCAGFNGHGMARIFTCAPGVAKLILGGSWADTGLPECFEITQERLEKLQKGVSGSVF
ncbi:FAD dependent oxidoreductase [Annulohypoxylon maeteangense]|uniref:FAD dependent oxidoreductase n=1 Tax=Annulohypoxylon maeteangense TaxID=1927788 RepID=UPI0020076032|nr:FAD dependent oxidoreductase [Annulohypoxylon maeteangense]KAI0884596.1 FAD dependent oxidoreductase [Annulohypoxylon maeteangense]